nr:hypothetical protein [uncultured Allomuricauda sp.]
MKSKNCNKAFLRCTALLILFIGLGGERCHAQKQLQINRVLEDIPLVQPLSITFTDSLEIIVGDVFQYRPTGESIKWELSPADSTGTHAIDWKRKNDGTKVLYAVGTNKDLILKFDAIDKKPKIFDKNDIPELNRPHDILYNDHDGYFYVINANYGAENKYLIRFEDLEMGYEILNLKPIIKHGRWAYARALSLVNKKVYIVLSSYGEVIRIDNFKSGKHKYYGYKEREPATAGSYSKTGLVLNDVMRFDGNWYGTNFFSSSYANGSDHNSYRFVRWKNWNQFKKGRLEDLSGLISKDEVPYYMTVNNNKLYLVTFPDEDLTQKATPIRKKGKVYIMSNRD